MYIKNWDLFIEGVYFDENFTPLYHMVSTTWLPRTLETDKIRMGYVARGPKGICVTRSKYFTHDSNNGILNGSRFRIILNKELLEQHGYQSYPIDEWALINMKDSVKDRDKWRNYKAIKGHHLGKSNLPNLKSGKRPIPNKVGLPNPVGGWGKLEVEYEERILKPILKAGRFIYAINLTDDIYKRHKYVIDTYIEKYPHIKLLTGEHRFKEMILDISTPVKKEEIISTPVKKEEFNPKTFFNAADQSKLDPNSQVSKILNKY